MNEKPLTKREKLVLLLRELRLIHGGYSGRVEIHVSQGSIRNIIKVENVDIAAD